jgi:anti-sigma factor RsiW
MSGAGKDAAGGSHAHHDCRAQINEFLSGYVQGELPEPQREVFEQHLIDCPPCREYLDSYRMTIDACRVACCHKKNPELAAIPNQLIKAILAARSAPSGE